MCDDRTRTLLQARQGESDLLYIGGAWYLAATVNFTEPPTEEITAYLGVDLGIVNIATDSDGAMYSGAHVTGLRRRHARLRAKLQALAGCDPTQPSGRTALLAAGFAGLLHHLQQPTAMLRPLTRRLPRSRWAWLNSMGYGVAVAFLGFFGIQAGIALVGAVGDGWTTLQYGDPRTTHLTAAFGFAGESLDTPTRITAINDGGIGHIFILPGSQAAKALVLELPLTAQERRLPLKLSAADVDRDGHPDLLVQPGDGPIWPYLLDTGKGTFRPPTAEEQTRLFLPEGNH